METKTPPLPHYLEYDFRYTGMKETINGSKSQICMPFLLLIKKIHSHMTFPKPSSLSKCRAGLENPSGQNRRIGEYFVTWNTVKWRFRRSFSAISGSVCFLASWNRCSKQTKTCISSCFMRQNASEVFGVFWLPYPGASPPDPPFWIEQSGEGPGNELGTILILGAFHLNGKTG